MRNRILRDRGCFYHSTVSHDKNFDFWIWQFLVDIASLLLLVPNLTSRCWFTRSRFAGTRFTDLQCEIGNYRLKWKLNSLLNIDDLERYSMDSFFCFFLLFEWTVTLLVIPIESSLMMHIELTFGVRITQILLMDGAPHYSTFRAPKTNSKLFSLVRLITKYRSLGLTTWALINENCEVQN